MSNDRLIGLVLALCLVAAALSVSAIVEEVSSSASTDPFPTLALDDEFTGSSGSLPNQTIWTAKTLAGSSQSIAYFNGWTQTQLDGNGNLVITAQRQKSGTWLSGWLSSKSGLESPLRYSVRAKMAPGYGMWSAPGWSFLYPYGACPNGEVDDIEQLGRQPSVAHESAHWCDSSGVFHGVTQSHDMGVDLSQGYHVYGAEIYSDRILYYVDGVLVRTYTSADTGGYWPFTPQNTAFNVDLDVGACGSWADCPPANAPKTEKMYVDYFRVYTP